MFEQPTAPDWDRVDAIIELACALARAEARHRAQRALDDIDVMLGLQEPSSEAFYNRSLGQKLRFARARVNQGVTA